MEATLKHITNHSLNLANGFPQWLIPFKADISFYSNALQYSGANKRGL